MPLFILIDHGYYTAHTAAADDRPQNRSSHISHILIISIQVDDYSPRPSHQLFNWKIFLVDFREISRLVGNGYTGRKQITDNIDFYYIYTAD
jgi:hypothetical protein